MEYMELKTDRIIAKCGDIKSLDPNRHIDHFKSYTLLPFSASEQPIHKAGCSDASFNCLWQVTRSTEYGYYHYPIFFGIVQASIIETEYCIQPEKTYPSMYATNFLMIRIDLDQKKTYWNAEAVFNKMMSLYEQYNIYKYAKQTTNRVIMLDGSLYHGSVYQAEHVKEDTKKDVEMLSSIVSILSETISIADMVVSLEDLITICKQNKHILIGVTKESSLIDDSIHIPYEIIFRQVIKVNGLSPNYYYYPIKNIITQISDPIHICFASLHPHALKWHRVDWVDTGYDLETQILPTIAQFSQFSLFLGTPYPLQKAHTKAVDIRRLGDVLEERLFSALKELGFSSHELFNGKTDPHGRLLNNRSFHDYLDLIV